MQLSVVLSHGGDDSLQYYACSVCYLLLSTESLFVARSESAAIANLNINRLLQTNLASSNSSSTHRSGNADSYTTSIEYALRNQSLSVRRAR
eukprot:g79706.t1